MRHTKTMLYNLVWVVNGVVKETLMYNKPKPLCLWEKRSRKSNYTAGLLRVRKNEK